MRGNNVREGLLRAARGDRRGLPRRLVPLRRPRGLAPRRLHRAARPQEGHHHLGRREHLDDRGRAERGPAPGGAGVRGGRHPRREVGRAAQGLRHAQAGPAAPPSRRSSSSAAAHRALQVPGRGRVRRAAQDLDRQDPEVRAARPGVEGPRRSGSTSSDARRRSSTSRRCGAAARPPTRSTRRSSWPARPTAGAIHRYWLAEHHSTPGPGRGEPRGADRPGGRASPATSGWARAASCCRTTARSRWPSSFRMLETLHPGRIDLGIGRAPGSDQRTARVLRHGPGALGIEHYPRQIADLVAFLHDDLPAEHPLRGVHAMPAGPTRAGGVAPGLERRERAAGGPARPGLLLRPLHQRAGRGGGHARLSRAVLRLARPGRAAQQRGRLRGLRGHGGRGAAAGAEPRSLHRAALHRPARAVPVGRGGGELSLQCPGGGHRPARGPAQRGRHARAGARAAACRWSPTTRPTS